MDCTEVRERENLLVCESEKSGRVVSKDQLSTLVTLRRVLSQEQLSPRTSGLEQRQNCLMLTNEDFQCNPQHN